MESQERTKRKWVMGSDGYSKAMVAFQMQEVMTEFTHVWVMVPTWKRQPNASYSDLEVRNYRESGEKQNIYIRSLNIKGEVENGK